MCSVPGCYRAGWDVCPNCARKERRRIRAERKVCPEPSGDQQTLFLPRRDRRGSNCDTGVIENSSFLPNPRCNRE